MRKLWLIGMLAAVVMFGATSAFAWEGDGVHFSYSNGSDLNGQFGTPDTYGTDTLYFPLTNFLATSSDGAGLVTDSDTVSFDMTLDPLWEFTMIRFVVYGTYTVSGLDASVNWDPLIVASDGINAWDSDNLLWGGTATTPSPMPYTSGSGPWDGLNIIDFTLVVPAPVYPNFHLDVTNILEAYSGTVGSSATINNTFSSLEMAIVFIPEPGSLALLALGGVALLRRRR